MLTDGVLVTTLRPNEPLPMVVHAHNETSKIFLKTWCKNHKDFIESKLYDVGAILFRGFDIFTPEDFEEVALQIHPQLHTDYIGTSARFRKTEHVFTSAELAPPYPIPQHCELSYAKNYPSIIMFACMIPPKTGGETPLCDSRKVYEDLDIKIRDKWEKKGITLLEKLLPPKCL